MKESVGTFEVQVDRKNGADGQVSVAFKTTEINAVSNKTSLIVTHASTISVLNFWKDRIIPSREFVPEEVIEDEEDWETGESFFRGG